MKSIQQIVKEVFDENTLASSAASIVSIIIGDLKALVDVADTATHAYLDDIEKNSALLFAATFANTPEAMQVNPDNIFIAGMTANAEEPVVVEVAPVVVEAPVVEPAPVVEEPVAPVTAKVK